MEPVTITMIVAALAAGAAAAAKDLGGAVVKDAYNALKALIGDRYKRAGAVAAVEEDPSSDPQKKALEEALTKTDAGKDEELIERSKRLSGALATIPPDQFERVTGIKIKELEAANALFERVKVSGRNAAGIVVDKATVKQDFIVRDVEINDPN